LADRPMEHQEFMVDNPSRLVIDFTNAENRVPFWQLPVNHAHVRRLRVAQFQDTEPKIARVVFDLDEGYGKHEIERDAGSLRIRFESGAAESASNVGQSAAPAKTSAAPVPPSQAENKPAAVAPSAPLAAENRPTAASEPKGPAAPPIQTASLQATPLPAVPAPQESPDTAQPLTLDLVDIPLVDFFRLMAEEGGVNLVIDPVIKGNISIKVVKVPWDQIFETALINNNLDKQVEGNMIRIARKATLQEEAKQQEALKKANLLAADLETRIRRLNYAKAESFLKTLADQKTVRGTIVVDERTNSLILTDIPGSLEKLLKLVDSLDISQPQVEIEARIVSGTRDFARDIGIQFGFVQGNLKRVTVGGPNTYGTIGGTRPSATPGSTYVAGNSSTGRGASESTTGESAAVSTGTSNNTLGNYNVNLAASKAFGGLGVSIGNILDTFLLDAAITAGESKGLAKLISQPKVTAQNNSPATITQGLRFPVQIVANNTVAVQFQNAALTLTVTPQITYEGNVVLDLRVENNTPDFSNAVNGIPSIRTSESTTKVLVTDGGTTVIGGILIDDESSSEDRIPGLGSLPILGSLFRRTSSSHATQEVLFFITPRIIR
jgi:type IV pilus secretin PilQ/predicted competence protein